MNCREIFHFRKFTVCQDNAPLKINTDALLLGALVPAENARHILDIGTGTGVISLMLAQRAPDAEIVALEPDGRAARLAKQNFNNSQWSNRLTLKIQPLQQFDNTSLFDLIVSNPPFYEYHPHQSPDPAKHKTFLPIHELFYFSKKLLVENGKLAVIYPSSNAYQILEAAYENNFFPLQQIRIKSFPSSDPLRDIWILGQNFQRNFIKQDLVLLHNNHFRTDEFKKLMEPYLNS